MHHLLGGIYLNLLHNQCVSIARNEKTIDSIKAGVVILKMNLCQEVNFFDVSFMLPCFGKWDTQNDLCNSWMKNECFEIKTKEWFVKAFNALNVSYRTTRALIHIILLKQSCCLTLSWILHKNACRPNLPSDHYKGLLLLEHPCCQHNIYIHFCLN